MDVKALPDLSLAHLPTSPVGTLPLAYTVLRPHWISQRALPFNLCTCCVFIVPGTPFQWLLLALQLSEARPDRPPLLAMVDPDGQPVQPLLIISTLYGNWPLQVKSV